MESSKYRWVVTFLAFFGLIINILDRSALSYAIKPMEAEFHLNNTHFGILSSAFSVGYLIMVFFGGIIVDKVGARSVWTLTAVIWSIATLLLGFCSGFIMLFALRLVTGAAEGPTGPSLMKAVTNYLPLKERGLAFAIIIAASPLSSVIGAPLCSFLITEFNWKIMFFVLGVLGVIWAIIWFIYYRDTPQQSKYISQTELNLIRSVGNLPVGDLPVGNLPLIKQYKVSLHFILTNRSLWLNNYAFFAYGYLLFFAISWLPGYLLQEFGLTLKQVGVILTIPWLVTTVLMLVFGYLSDKIYAKTRSIRLSRSLLIGVSLVVSALFFIPTIKVSSLPVIIICLSFALGFGLAPSSCFYALNADLAKDRASTSVGIMVGCLAIAGIIAPIITGWISTLTGSFSSAMYIMLLLNISSGILVILFQKPD